MRIKTVLFAGLAIATFASGPLLAGNMHNSQRNGSTVCKAAIAAKGVKGDAGKAEYQKCIVDPGAYR
jgi:hypothetical protein